MGYSQCGEEGIIGQVFNTMGTTNLFAVDIGAGDGWNLSNVRAMINRGWKALLIDGKETPSDGVVRALVTAENVDQLLDDNGAPDEPDFMSLDIDGIDWWVLNATRRRPRLMLVEFNGALPRGKAITVPYDPHFRHDGTTYYGASFAAFVKLGHQRGYVPLCQIQEQNLFLIRRDCLGTDEEPKVDYEPRTYHHPMDPKLPWVAV